MKRLNNRGFAVTTLLYGILILVFLSVFSIMAYMSTNRSDTKKLIESIKDDLSGFDRKRVVFSFDSIDTSSIGLQDVYYTGGIPYQVSEDGYYKIELCGAQGGSTSSGVGGKGACTSGLIYLEKGDELKFYLGGKPSNDVTKVNSNLYCKKAGLGGGGYACGNSSTLSYAADGSALLPLASGGGATYVTLGGGNVIMVAAGGGGAAGSMDGGAGGTLFGLSKGTTKGGGQESGNHLSGGSYNDSILGGAGGSGYYGGQAGSSVSQSGAGGSSYISGYAGVISQGQSGEALTISKTKKYFIKAEMTAGENEGNGTAKIEKINFSKDEHKIKYIKDCITNTTSLIKYSEIQVISGGKNIAYGKEVKRLINDYDNGTIDNVTDGDITTVETDGYTPNYYTDNVCILLDLGGLYDIDEIAIWNDWETPVSSQDHTISTSKDGSTYSQIYSGSVSATVNGIRHDFNS